MTEEIILKKWGLEKGSDSLTLRQKYEKENILMRGHFELWGFR